MPLDTRNTEVVKEPSQAQPPLLEVPVPTMPSTTTAIVVPLELPWQVQQSTEVVHSPCAMLDIQGNDTGHLRSSMTLISKEGKKVDVTDITTLNINSGPSLRCNMSLPTSDTLAKLPP